MAKIKVKVKKGVEEQPKPKPGGKPNNSPIVDNTRVKKVIPTPSEPNPKYTYKKSKFTSSDSLDYKKGFNAALKSEASRKPDFINPNRNRAGSLVIVGLNDRFNEGYSEGRDVVLKNKKK
jgi:hypothetical protein